MHPSSKICHKGFIKNKLKCDTIVLISIRQLLFARMSWKIIYNLLGPTWVKAILSEWQRMWLKTCKIYCNWNRPPTLLIIRVHRLACNIWWVAESTFFMLIRWWCRQNMIFKMYSFVQYNSNCGVSSLSCPASFLPLPVDPIYLFIHSFYFIYFMQIEQASIYMPWIVLVTMDWLDCLGWTNYVALSFTSQAFPRVVRAFSSHPPSFSLSSSSTPCCSPSSSSSYLYNVVYLNRTISFLVNQVERTADQPSLRGPCSRAEIAQGTVRQSTRWSLQSQYYHHHNQNL